MIRGWIDLSVPFAVPFPFPHHRKKNRPLPGPAPSHADVSYGDHPRQRLDFWRPLADSSRPAAVVVFFHSGGFIKGNKHYARVLREMHCHGAAVVAANYRFVNRRGVTVEDAMRDGAATVRFLRSRAEEWNLDPARIALAGNSSGGCIAQWVALTEPDICGAACWNAPTSMDPEWMAHLGSRRLIEYWPLWALYFDAPTIRELRNPETQARIERCSPLNRVHAGAPPLFLEYAKDLTAIRRAGWLDTLHHVRFGEMMRNRYEKLGLRCLLKHPGTPDQDPVERNDFLRQVLEL